MNLNPVPSQRGKRNKPRKRKPSLNAQKLGKSPDLVRQEEMDRESDVESPSKAKSDLSTKEPETVTVELSVPNSEVVQKTLSQPSAELEQVNINIKTIEQTPAHNTTQENNESLINELAVTLKNFNDAQITIAQLQSTNESLKKNVADLEEEKARLTSTVSDHEKNIDDAKKAIAELREQKSTEALNEEVAELRKNLQEAVNKLASLTTEKGNLTTEVTLFKARLEESNVALASANSENVQLITNSKSLQELVHKEKQLREVADKENEEKFKQIEILKQQLVNSNADFKSATEKYEQVQAELIALKRVQGNNASSSKSDEVSHLKGSIAALEAEVAALTKKLKSLTEAKGQERMQISVAHENDGDQVTYLIMVSTDMQDYPRDYWSVARRYNQFRALYERIEKISDIGIWFKFPERTYIIPKNNPEVVEERKVSFQKLCQAIAFDPVLRTNPTVKQFLDPKDKFDLPIWS